MRLLHLAALLGGAALLLPPGALAESNLPAVSAVNGKLSAEGGVAGGAGDTSGLATIAGSFAAPLGHPFGFQIDGLSGVTSNTPFFAGTAHLFWRDPEIGLFGPIASIAGGGGDRTGWYGAEAELYAGRFTIGAWGGYHDAVDNVLGLGASSGFYGGGIKLYPIPDLALSLGVNSEFQRATGSGTLEYQPTAFGRHNLSFLVHGEVGPNSTYSVTAGIRFYFGADKPLIRRHREDDPGSLEAAYAATVHPAAIAANRALLQSLIATNVLGQNTPAIAAQQERYAADWLP